MEGNNLDVKKGAWTKEEDGLLIKCMENHGEGKWHEVPYKAGIHSCKIYITLEKRDIQLN